MKFLSTRSVGNSLGYTTGAAVVNTVSIRQALKTGLASDGGLFVPESFPHFHTSDFSGASDIASVGDILLRPFFADDPELSAELGSICENAFNFPISLRKAPANRPGDFILELYHGPTSAFKDVGARFLAACMEVILKNEKGGVKSKTPSPLEKKTVLVATSGDTGGAVASAFFNRSGIDVVILYPKGKISPRQEKQLCAWGANVRAIAVKGAFDDCQRIVKEALLDRPWLSANSINLGRILPQMVYYAWASLQRAGARVGSSNHPGFIIPSGNLGNSVAALWAKRMGLPIGPIVLACNANRPVVDYIESGVFSAHPTIPTLANAMDVGNPSNLERMRALYPSIEALRSDVRAVSVSDAEISDEIRISEKVWGQVFCPHTATAGVVRKSLGGSVSLSESEEWILIATAHPAKFETIVEPLIGRTVEMPPALAALMNRPSVSIEIEPTYAALLRALFSKI